MDDKSKIGPPRQLQPKEQKIAPGDIVYFKRAKNSSSLKSRFLEFQGHAFGLLLGHVPPFQKDPPKDFVLRLLGSHGLILFDDIHEFLGPEILKELVTKFEAKYYPQSEAEQTELPLDGTPELEAEEAPAPSRLVGIDGKPLNEVH